MRSHLNRPAMAAYTRSCRSTTWPHSLFRTISCRRSCAACSPRSASTRRSASRSAPCPKRRTRAETAMRWCTLSWPPCRKPMSTISRCLRPAAMASCRTRCPRFAGRGTVPSSHLPCPATTTLWPPGVTAPSIPTVWPRRSGWPSASPPHASGTTSSAWSMTTSVFQSSGLQKARSRPITTGRSRATSAGGCPTSTSASTCGCGELSVSVRSTTQQSCRTRPSFSR